MRSELRNITGFYTQEMDKIGKGDTEDAFLLQVYQYSGKDLKEEFFIKYLDHLK